MSRMANNLKFTIVMASGYIGLLLLAPSAFAQPSYRDIQSASVSNGALTATATATVAANFSSGVPNLYGIAFAGSNSIGPPNLEVIAITIHPGVDDSVAQGGNPSSDVAHTHRVATEGTSECSSGLAVKPIGSGTTATSPSYLESGVLTLSNGGKTLTITGIPLSGPLSVGSLTGIVASFSLSAENGRICINPDQFFEATVVAPPVGGEILGINMTTLFISGIVSNSGWIASIAGVTIAGIVGFVLRRRFR